MDIAFIDIETTGLDPQHDDVWEVGIIAPNGIEFNAMVMQQFHNLAQASKDALRIGRYYERNDGNDETRGYAPGNVAEEIAIRTSGCVLAGANPVFDQTFLDAWMRRHGYAPAWDYHVLDVPTYAAGVLNTRTSHAPQGGRLLEPPYRMNNQLFELLGLNELKYRADKHTALGDARTAKACWDRANDLMGAPILQQIIEVD